MKIYNITSWVNISLKVTACFYVAFVAFAA